MLVALLVFDAPDFYDRLGTISPWLESDFTPIDAIRERLGAQEHRRFIKTHVPLDGLPLDERVTYVVVGRDPRDIWLSRGQHGENVDLERVGPILAANLGEEEFARRAARSHGSSRSPRRWRLRRATTRSGRIPPTCCTTSAPAGTAVTRTTCCCCTTPTCNPTWSAR